MTASGEPSPDRADDRRGVHHPLPGWAPPAILAGVVLVFAVVAAMVVLGTEPAERPEAGTIPLPEGATVRFMEERCPSPEIDQPADGPTRCDIVLAVGPLEGLWTPDRTGRLLAEHLREVGWDRSAGEVAGPDGSVLVAPDGTMVVRIEPLEATDQRDPALGEEIRDRIRDFVDPDELAVLTAFPRG